MPIDEEINQLCEDISLSFENRNTKDAQQAYGELVLKLELLLVSRGLVYIAIFDEACNQDPAFVYWREYMTMAGILLRFTRSILEGDWRLFLSTFAEMLPYFAEFDHTNYTRWGTVFLGDMEMLMETAPEVYQGFLNGDFVVQEGDNKFNQIPVMTRL